MNPTLWSFPEREDEPAHELWLPQDEAAGPVPGVVLSGDLFARPGHGLLSTLGPELAARGFVAISASPAAGRDSPRFAGGTLRDREDEAARLVTALFERMVAAGRADIRKLALVGPGLGGDAAASRAAEDERVGAVVAIAAPRAPRACFPSKAIDAWTAGRKAHLADPADGTQHAVGPELLADWKRRAEALDHSRAARRTRAAFLWVHGLEDDVVSVEESRRAYWNHPDAGRRARLVEVAGAGHDFATPPQARKVADAIAELLGSAFPAAPPA